MGVEYAHLPLSMPRPYIPNDKLSRKAAEEGYRARSVYKLQEIDDRFHFLVPGCTVLDVGAAPGSWLQFASRKVGSTGKVLGIDRLPIDYIAPNTKTCQCDIESMDIVEKFLEENNVQLVDIVLSDIAPNTTGIKDVDQWRSVELCRIVLHLAIRVLKGNGFLVMKVFRGKSFDQFTADIKAHFGKIKVMTVEASRDRSKEVYVVAWKLDRKS